MKLIEIAYLKTPIILRISLSSAKASAGISEMKKGRIDIKSMKFILPLRNWPFLGAAANLTIYSTMNHIMQTTSNIARLGLSEIFEKNEVVISKT